MLFGGLVGQERRHVALVELRRPVQRHLRPDRREPATEGGAAEAVVGGLQLLRGGGVHPEHHVGVGTQTRHVVDAAHHDVGLGQLGEQLLDLGTLRGRSASSPSTASRRKTDHIV